MGEEVLGTKAEFLQSQGLAEVKLKMKGQKGLSNLAVWCCRPNWFSYLKAAIVDHFVELV